MPSQNYCVILLTIVLSCACQPNEPLKLHESAASSFAVERADEQSRIAAAGGPTAKLRLLETTDLHVNLESFNYYQDKSDPNIGLVRAAVLIRRARGEVSNSLLIDNGDLIQGTPLGDWFYKTKDPHKDLHSVYKGLNLLGYDAANIGNHEFNFGLDFLTASLRGAAFPYVSANVKRLGPSHTPSTSFVAPYVLLKRMLKVDGGGTDQITIGVIGFTPPQIMIWDRSNLAGRLCTDDIVDAAKTYVPRMKAEGADVIIAVPHSGLTAAERTGDDESAVTYLAQLPQIDAILAGHQHLVFPSASFADIPGVDLNAGTVAGVPTVMAGAFGSHVGVVDLDLKKVDGHWHVSGGRAQARELKTWLKPEDAAIDVRQAVAADHAATITYLKKPIGSTLEPMDSYWAQIAPSPIVEVVQKAQIAYMHQLIDQPNSPYAKFRGLPILAAAAPMKAGYKPDFYNDQPAGPLSLRNVAEWYIYANTVRLLKINGADLRDWLEMAAGAFNQIQPRQPGEQALINPVYKAYNFDQMLGVNYDIDAAQPPRFDPAGKLANPAAHRIASLTYQGRPVHDADQFLVATHNYRANGGGNFPHLNGQQVVIDPGKDVLEILTEYVASNSPLSQLHTQNWRLLPVPGATVVLRSAPEARHHLDTSPLPVHFLGMDNDGFARFRVEL